MEFDGIDLEKLENSDGPVLNSDGTDESNTNTQEKDKDATGDDGVIPPVEDPNAIDLDLVANTIASEDTPGGEVNTENGKKDKDTVPADNNTAAISSSQNTFTSLASALVEAGTISELTDEDLAGITDASSLLGALDKQVKNNEFSGLNDTQKQYLEALATGVPHDTFVHVKANADQYEQITDEALTSRPDLQKELIKRSFLIKGLNEDKASKYAELAMKGDDALNDAIDSKTALVAFENGKLQDSINARKQEQADNITKADKDLADLKSKITDTSEVIPGIKVNSNTRDKIFKSMTTPIKVKDENPLNDVMDQYSNDPEYKMKLHALHVITKGFTDFSKFNKTFKSSAAKNLEETVSKQGGLITGGSMSTGVVSTSQLEIKNALDNLEL